MIFDLINRTMEFNTACNNVKVIELSKLEYEMMLLLMDNKLHTYEEICNKIYGYEDKQSLRSIVSRLRRKNKLLSIRSRINQGFICETKLIIRK